VGCRQTKLHSAKGKKTMHLCEIETKTKSNRFKMLKLVHKSKPNKFHGGKLTCGSHDGRQNMEASSRGRGTMA